MSKRSLTLLAKAVGAPNLDPIPPDQYLWMQQSGEPPLYRFWSWMIYSTMHWGRDSAYAVDKEGNELHLENAATQLGIDENNIYKYWKEGLAKGLWRAGTPREGRRRIYLCGKVTPTTEVEQAKKIEADEERKIVCTYNLTPYIYKKIKDWPPEQREKFLAERLIDVRVRNVSLAELMAAGRDILDRLDDTRFRAWGLEKRREGKEKSRTRTSDAAEQREGRTDRVASLLPHVDLYVQTVLVSVQSAEPALYNDSVQSPASLLTQKTTRRGQNVGSIPQPTHSVNSEPSEQSLRGGEVATQPRTWEQPEVDAVKTALTREWGSSLPEDATEVPEKLLDLASGKLGLPVRALCVWIQDFAKAKRRKNYLIESPLLWLHAAKTALPSWIKGNLVLIESASRDEERQAHARFSDRVQALFKQLPAWQKLLPRGAGGDEIQPDNGQHVDGVVAIAQQLGDIDPIKFGLYAEGRLKSMDFRSLAKLPGRAPNAPAGPRILAVVYEMAWEFTHQRTQSREGAR